MSKNFIIGIIASLILLGGIVVLANPSKKNSEANANTISNGILEATEQSFDFGTISMAKGKVSHDFAVTNTGTEPITFGRMFTSCMCTQAKLILNQNTYGPYGMEGMGFIPKINKQINPDETATVETIFDPAAHGPAGIGKIERVVTLENNAGSPLEFRFSAEVTP